MGDDIAIRDTVDTVARTAGGEGRSSEDGASGCGVYSLLGIRQQRLTADQAQHLPMVRRGRVAREREEQTDERDDGEEERERESERDDVGARPS